MKSKNINIRAERAASRKNHCESEGWRGDLATTCRMFGQETRGGEGRGKKLLPMTPRHRGREPGRDRWR